MSGSLTLTKTLVGGETHFLVFAPTLIYVLELVGGGPTPSSLLFGPFMGLLQPPDRPTDKQTEDNNVSNI